MALTILSEQDIVLIHEATLDVLENTGVTFLNVPEAVRS
jgi:trimethylamine:corrinoid methyltransferase-like protein